MRSSSIVLTVSLALLAATACDKTEPAADSKSKDEVAQKGDATPAAKKEGEAPEADPEEGCIHEGEHAKKADGESCEHEAPAADGASTGHFGAEFAVADTQPLAGVLAGELPADAVKVSGTVEAVCQAKGCWMVIKDGEMQARVLVKDHAFAIPMDGKGKAAVVEGTLEEKQLDEANVAHLKKDGDDTLEGDGPRKEYFLHATAVDLS